MKDNQRNIHEQLKWFFSDIELPADLSSGLVARHESFDKDHGRLERRDYLVSGELDWMKKELDGFPQVKSIGMVRCKRTMGAKTSTEIRYCLSSLEPDPLLFARSVRGHWGIENSLHWVLDVTFREDESRKRQGHSPANMAVLRRIALMLVKRDRASKKSLRLRRKQATWDDQLPAVPPVASRPCSHCLPGVAIVRLPCVNPASGRERRSQGGSLLGCPPVSGSLSST